MTRYARLAAFAALIAAAIFCCPYGRAQAALLLEQPYGIYGLLNPTGHNAVYFQRVCAETPVKLRRCRPGEMGSVISRYEGIDGYDWIAMPLIPYLYSVEKAGDVPARVTHREVIQMRDRYREVHFHPMGLDRSGGSWVPDGWTQLVGAAYERRIYAFRFDTTPEQDDRVIRRLNSEPNRSHFHMLTRNCADFSRTILNLYFPHRFHRSFFPDIGISTPKQMTGKLVRYARRHPQLDLTIFEIPQIPGFRRFSQKNKDVAESFVTTAYAVPLTIISPYITGGLFIDYLARGRYQLIRKHPEVLGPESLDALMKPDSAAENPPTTATFTLPRAEPAVSPAADPLITETEPASDAAVSSSGPATGVSPSASAVRMNGPSE
ncbi:MAG TPA: hypothetical protein VGS10_03340 [Terracidiphilus sp.]|nr:hypothetical protein [Terracidiphilus sp.]